MLLSEIASTSERVTHTNSRLEKIGHLSACLSRLAPNEIEIGVDYLVGKLRQGHLGIGPATLREVLPAPATMQSSLNLLQVDEAFKRLAETTGPGSAAERRRMLARLFACATSQEQDFLVRLVLGELRQGALEAVIAEAIARTWRVAASDVRRALMLAGDLVVVAKAASAGGTAGLKRFTIQLLQPIRPMLAQTADDVSEALSGQGVVGIEFKLDGARIQLHKAGEQVSWLRRWTPLTRPATGEAAGSR